MIAAKQYEDLSYAGYYNVGPDDEDCISTGELVSLFCERWNAAENDSNLSWIDKSVKDSPHEANFLKLDCSKLKSSFGWKPKWHIADAVEQTVKFTEVMLRDEGPESIKKEMVREIEEFR